MADIKKIGHTLADWGCPPVISRGHGIIPTKEDGGIKFTGEYAQFLQNPNFYYFKDNEVAAANFIIDGCRNLAWRTEDINSSLNCEKDQLYYTCMLYDKISKKEVVTSEEIHRLYCLFKDSIRGLLDDYCKDFGMKYKSFSLFLGRRTDGSCTQDNQLEFSTDLVLRNPNYIKGVILHELCHTVYHNHRMKFWKLLSEMLAGEGITPLSGYVNSELFAVQKDYYIDLPIIRGGPNDEYIKCIPHYDMFRNERRKDK